MIWTLRCTFGELKGVWAFGWILGYLGLWENLGTEPILVFLCFIVTKILNFSILTPPPPFWGAAMPEPNISASSKWVDQNKSSAV